MAKGPGTVGRKPKPKTYGPPIIFPGYGGGGGPTTPPKGTRPIPVKQRPRPDMEWYDDDQRPVRASDRIYHPEKGKNADTYRTALENIDKVHGVKASQNPMQLSAQSAPNNGTLGLHQGRVYVEIEPGPNQGKVRDYSHITLNTAYHKGNEPGRRSTLYHEIGHGNDRQQNFEDKVLPNVAERGNYFRRQYDSENAWEKVRKSGTLDPEKGDTPTVQWAKSVQSSQSYKSLVVKRDKARKDGTNPGLVRYLDYLTDPKELYARSYAQYISRKADPAVEKVWRENYRGQDSDMKKYVGYTQWRGKDFDSIGASFDRIYGSRGLDIHNMRHDPRVPVEV